VGAERVSWYLHYYGYFYASMSLKYV